MKKFLGIILLVALTLVTFGCKMDKDMGDKVRNWNILAQDGACGDRAVTLKVEKGDITWFCWTVHQNDGGYIQTPGKDYKIYEYDDAKDHKGTLLKNVECLENGKTYIFEFGVERAYDLYIHQPDAEKSASGTKDFRGKVKVEGNTVHLKDSGYKDITGKNVEVWIDHNEPNGTSFWKGGDYTVTELWPLLLETPNVNGEDNKGSIWKVQQSLKYTNLEFVNGNTAGWLFPLEEGKDILVAMYQPRRGNGTPKDDATEAEQAENLNTYFGKVLKYSEIPENRRLPNVTSASFNDKEFLKTDDVFTAKSALGTIEYYTVFDVPEGMTK